MIKQTRASNGPEWCQSILTCLIVLAIGQMGLVGAMQANNNVELLAMTNADRHHNSPGHYEFEMAPKMEPPSVRKPPYLQSAFVCPGSGEFNAPTLLASAY